MTHVSMYRTMSLRTRWVNMLHGVATGTRRTRNLLTPFGLIIFALFTGLFVLGARVLDRTADLTWPLGRAATWAVATPLLAIGAAVTAWSVRHFLKARGTPVPLNPPPTLVASGPYRYVRNPMLTGVFLLLFGLGFATGSLSLVFVFTPLYVLANVFELKYIEEPELVKRLGDDYRAYRDRTPMFIPRKRPG